MSYGKDSLACLEAIRQLEYPLDAIIHAEVWATDDIPADLPPMMEFKAKADKIIKERYGLEVVHLCATRERERERERERVTYAKHFYTEYLHKNRAVRTDKNGIFGFPFCMGAWCNSRLKIAALTQANIRKAVLSHTKAARSPDGGAIRDKQPNRIPGTHKTLVQQQTQNTMFTDSQSLSAGETGAHNSNREFSGSSIAQGADINIVQYLGIAADEPKRIERHSKEGVVLPLVDIGWDESYCRQWCEENDLLSPIYTNATRGGCWFCHNQSVDQLRLLRKEYPDYWALLLKWDDDSPTSFKPDGHTVHDFEKRFQAEDRGEIIPGDRRFRWRQVLD